LYELEHTPLYAGFEEAAEMRHALFVFKCGRRLAIGAFRLFKGGGEEAAESQPLEYLSDLRSIRLNFGAGF
jgi:hypothetical protein